ncbi:pyridoxamine 5'-phosphate oxidase family protein [Microbacterium esteraromaticum]|uniref:pyridoxamine 5'-phosphate oxidase family protein n=1 Tax=Microbacterium esteraromaticum TaxID=57043 RepID=UPI001956D47A|nr:pyridoxamine 5'-phosphate oxidase family protein [Microbacterium esteraromaticum]MBM7466830.1 nitroimidazol reductase NimA-like FMN-containing flavoprotein (pyridoxamine 5'-phosphate oxidase superfamily) [Microbacterium esteraromaticum]
MITQLDEQECLELLRTTTVGRIGFVQEGRVLIIPVNFLLDDRSIVIRTAPDGPLSTLASSRVLVAFEIDHHDNLAASGWSVLLNGEVDTITEEHLASLPGASSRLPWAEGDRSLLLRLTPTTISGRRVRRMR